MSPPAAPPSFVDFAVERNKDSEYWVTISGGIVTEIEEQDQP